MNKKLLIGISLSALLVGFLFFAIMQEWIVFIIPWRTSPCMVSQQVTLQEINFVIWMQNRWSNEKHTLVAVQDLASFIQHIINKWLEIVYAQGIMNKKVVAAHVAFNGPGQTAYISFDRRPFDKQSSCYQKLVWVEGLLRTLAQAHISIRGIQFLVCHEPLADLHLDFSQEWPLQGFLED